MKNLMKVFFVFFAIIVSLCSKNVVFAQDRTDFNIQDGYLSKYAGTTPVVEIPDDVVTIGKGVFKKHTEITSVTIPNGVTVIESEAFSGCKNLQNVTLPNGLVSIEEKAFYDCENFTGISIPGSVTNIGESAFSDCKNVSSIDIANGVQTIGSHAFSDNDNVTSIVVPDSVTVLGNYAFSSCNYLQNITFSKSLTKIPSCVVQYCKKIEKLKIPDGIQVLEKGCLNGCNNLTYLSVPDSVTSFAPFSYRYEIPKKLRIYCNTGTAAYDYAVANDIFYVPLENYESESSGNTGSTTGDTSGSTTEDTSGSTTGDTSGGMTGDTSGSTTGNTSGSTKPDTGSNTPVQSEKAIAAVECINRKCVRVSFTDGTSGVYDVPQMTPNASNMITIEEGGKQYQYSVICPSFNLTIESIQAISANEVQIKYSGDFVWDKKGSQITPDFVIPGFTDAGVLDTSYDQVNKIIVLKSPKTTKQDTLYTVQAMYYDEGAVIFNQNSFYGYEPVVSEPVQTPSTESDSSNEPAIAPPKEDTNISTDSSNTGNNSFPDTSQENDISSGTGWDDDYEEPASYDPPSLSVVKKTLKRKKSFTLRVKNAESAAKWKVKNKKIVKISRTKGYSVKVKGLKKGTTYITARVDGEVLRCKIKVK